MNRVVLIILLIFCCNAVLGQSIKITLPEVANQPYYFVLNRGLAQDTIQKGRLNFAGSAVIDIPPKDEGYKGIGLFKVQGGQSVFLVVGNESFGMERVGQTFRFSNSPENDYLHRALRGDNSLAVDPDLYAHHFLEMMRYVRQQNTALIQGTDLMGKMRLRQYATEKLDVEYLYTSGLWYFVIDNLMKLDGDQQMFGDDMVKILKRTKSQEVFEKLVDNLITITEQYGMEDAFDIIIPYVRESKRIAVPKGNVFDAFTKAKIRKGMEVPPLAGYQKQIDLPQSGKTIVIFYDPGCENCEVQLNELVTAYDTLTKKGVQVVSVSSASIKADYERDLKRFPWANKLCDFKGIGGGNFRNYGVLGTPTIFLVDAQNKLIGRYALVSHMNLD